MIWLTALLIVFNLELTEAIQATANIMFWLELVALACHWIIPLLNKNPKKIISALINSFLCPISMIVFSMIYNNTQDIKIMAILVWVHCLLASISRAVSITCDKE